MKEEDLFKELIHNTRAKRSFQIILSNDKTEFQTNFHPAIELNKDSSYEMALVNLETYYSFPNVDSKNNKFVYSIDETGWKNFEIPIGSYEIDDLDRLINNKVGVGHFRIKPNINTLKCVLIIEGQAKIDFKGNSIANLLGFEKKVYDYGTNGIYESSKPVNINSINSIFVNINIISGSIINGINKSIIYSFFPNVSPGYKIIEQPNNLIYLPIIGERIDEISTLITDQNFNKLDGRGETITLRFHIREI